MQNLDLIFDYIFRAISIIFSIVVFFVGISRNKSFREIKEDMKLFNNRNDDVVAQSFSNKKQEYTLDERLNVLVENGTTDLQDLINSSRGTALDELLKRMLPEDIVRSSYQEAYDRCNDDLDDMANLFDIAEEYRAKFGMPLTASISDIYKRMQSESTTLANKLKGGLKNETKERTQSLQGEQEAVQKYSSEGSQEEPPKENK